MLLRYNSTHQSNTKHKRKEPRELNRQIAIFYISDFKCEACSIVQVTRESIP